MFTGLIQTLGTVEEVSLTEAGVRLSVGSGRWNHTPAHGESISVSGVCLTVTETGAEPHHLVFDVIAETLARTTLGSLRPGSHVNLEASVTPATLLGGHLVQGHIDGVGSVTQLQDDAEDYRVTIAPPAELMPMMVPKGSVAVDGVSLTIAEVTGDAFTIALIPTTLEITTLSDLTVGNRVNIESDMIARAVVHAVHTMRASA